MKTLIRCERYFGGVILVERDPAILQLHDVLYVPFGDPKSPAGIFDHGQKLVLQSWYFRGQKALPQTSNLSTDYTYDGYRKAAPENGYIYGGWLHNHFGHFLLSSLSRYWSDAVTQHPSTKILVHSDCSIEEWFSKPWFASLFRAAGISQDRVVRLHEAAWIDTLILPAPAFEEENFVHRAYAHMGHRLGRIIAGDRITPPDLRPVYLSKAHLKHGVQMIANEDEITRYLEAAGVEIIYPEMLSFEEQVAIWFNRPFITSFVSSALHSSIFAPRRRMTVLTYNDSLISNFLLVDKANENKTVYLQPVEGQLRHIGPGENFSSRHVATNPAAIAETILRNLDFQLRSECSRQEPSSGLERPVWRYQPATANLPVSGSLLRNVAAGKPTRLSSTHPWVPHDSISATSGILTGRFQFHTDKENDPWWEVDLGQNTLVHVVRLFNRLDGGQERLGRFTIETRRDGEDWQIVHHQIEPAIIGGLDGKPFCWIPPEPQTLRHLRITLLAEDYLHLDQVEVLGERPSSCSPPPGKGLSTLMRKIWPYTYQSS